MVGLWSRWSCALRRPREAGGPVYRAACPEGGCRCLSVRARVGGFLRLARTDRWRTGPELVTLGQRAGRCRGLEEDNGGLLPVRDTRPGRPVASCSWAWEEFCLSGLGRSGGSRGTVSVAVCADWRAGARGHGHIDDSVRPKRAVRITARFADPRPFCPVTRAPRLLVSATVRVGCQTRVTCSDLQV